MTTPLSQFPKPGADQFQGKRKLLLVPILALHPASAGEGQRLLEQYWSEVRDHVGNLERALGPTSRVYHETVFSGDDEGMRFIELLNAGGYPFIHAMCQSTAQLEATEDQALVQENTDWQRCLGVGLISEKVMSAALTGYRETSRKRFEHVSARIEETLREDETGVLFVSEDHGIQFSPSIQVFYVAPPALDALKRWISDQSLAMSQAAQQPQATDDEQPSEEDGQAAK